MALVICPDCKKEVSSNAAACPNCGAPITSARTSTTVYNPRQDQFLTRNRGCLESMFWLAVIGIAFFWLTGCVPSSSQGLRESAGGKFSFEAEEDYRAVYREVLIGAKNCWGNGLDTVPMVVHGDLDDQQGNITAGVPGLTGLSTYFTVDVTPLPPARSKVEVYFVFQSMEPRARAVELWIKDKSTKCRLAEKDL